MGTNSDGIWIIGADAHTVYVNERMAEILGTSPSEMVGHPSFTYVFPEDVDHAQRLRNGKRAGNIDPFHFKLRRKDGSAVWVDVQGTPMFNAAGIQGNRRHFQCFKHPMSRPGASARCRPEGGAHPHDRGSWDPALGDCSCPRIR